MPGWRAWWWSERRVNVAGLSSFPAPGGCARVDEHRSRRLNRFDPRQSNPRLSSSQPPASSGQDKRKRSAKQDGCCKASSSSSSPASSAPCRDLTLPGRSGTATGTRFSKTSVAKTRLETAPKAKAVQRSSSPSFPRTIQYGSAEKLGGEKGARDGDGARTHGAYVAGGRVAAPPQRPGRIRPNARPVARAPEFRSFFPFGMGRHGSVEGAWKRKHRQQMSLPAPKERRDAASSGQGTGSSWGHGRLLCSPGTPGRRRCTRRHSRTAAHDRKGKKETIGR